MASKPRNVEAVFHVARKIESAEARAEYLEQICHDDPSMQSRVESLLRVHDEQPDFLETPPTEVDVTRDVTPVSEKPGEVIGPYKLLEEIGEGGMGVVYMADQREPVRRRVALKIIRPGMDTREVIARFEAERQALAMMDHPNIAKVLDAGTTETGRPYFVMELVYGVPVTKHCDDNDLTTEQRLELFVAVCHAIQHAHQKGIIHRDISAKNVLITMHDDVAVPKVIDFGIAKAVNQELTAQTIFTGYGQVIGTPLYMSPEQVEMSALGVDTRSDIYSLGVLLYELLTGSTPFDKEQLREAGLEEFRRIIREEEPSRPSTRISTMGKAATTVSSHRKTNPVKLTETLRRELDWVVMKALEKDRKRRYQSANDFARDIQRYLDDEAVEACPPSRLYRLRKFTRRNRVVVGTTLAIALALIVGAGVAAGQAYRATKAERFANEQLSKAQEQEQLANEAAKSECIQREAAEAARKQAEMVTFFLVDAFRSPDPDVDGRNVTVAELLDQASKQLANTLRTEPELQATLLLALGKTYGGLGLADEAIPLLEQSRRIRLERLGQEHPDTLASLTALVDAYWKADRNEEAATLATESRQLHLKVFGSDHLLTLQHASSAICAFSKTGNVARAISFGELSLQAARGSLGREDEATVDIMHNLGMTYSQAGQHARAIRLLEEAVELNRKKQRPEHSSILTNMKELSAAYARAGRYEDAMSLQEKASTLCRGVLGLEHPLTMMCMTDRGFILYQAGHYAKAATVYDECLKIERSNEVTASSGTVHTMVNLAVNQLMAGQFKAAVQLNQAALQQYVQAFGAEHRTTRFAWQTFSRMLVATGQYDSAVKLLERIVPDLNDSFGPQHNDTLWMTMQLARAYAGLGRVDEAVETGEIALRQARAAFGDDHRETYRMMDWMARLYSAAGHHDRAITLLKTTLPLMSEEFGPEHVHTLGVMVDLAIASKAASQLDKATNLLEQALPLREKVLGKDHPETLAAMIVLGSCYGEQGKHANAEPLMLAAYDGCTQRFDSFPTPLDGSQAAKACKQLIQLYEELNQTDEVGECKEKLAALTEKLQTIPSQPNDVDEIIAAYGVR